MFALEGQAMIRMGERASMSLGFNDICHRMADPRQAPRRTKSGLYMHRLLDI